MFYIASQDIMLFPPGGQAFNPQLSKCCRLVTCFLIYRLHDHNVPYINHAVMISKESSVFGCRNTSLRDYYICKWIDLSVTSIFFYILSLLISMKGLYRELQFLS